MRPHPARFPIVRLPSRRTAIAVVSALVCALLVLSITSSARADAARLGTDRPVWVATKPLAPGQLIDAGDVRADAWPTAFVAASAVDESPVGRMVAAEIGGGEVVLAGRLSGADRRGIAALVPAGWRAVALPPADGFLPVAPGDRVDVIAAVEVGDRGRWDAIVVGPSAVVVDVAGDGTTTVAVPADAVGALAAALVTGVVSLALVG